MASCFPPSNAVQARTIIMLGHHARSRPYGRQARAGLPSLAVARASEATPDGVPHIAALMRATIATNLTGKSLLIFRNGVKPGNQKYSAFVLTQISPITPLVSRQMRGVGHRHERAVRCGGRRWRARRARRKRTAKSCGSGAAVLALSVR